MTAPPTTPPKLVAVDLDGTLLNDRKQVAERTSAALKCLPALGVKVVIASARPPRSVRHIYRQLGLDTLQINYNGALVWDEPQNSVALHTPMPGELVRRTIAFARGKFPQVLVSTEIVDRWHTDRGDNTHTTETGRLFPPDVVAPLHTFDGLETTKLMFLADPPVISALLALLKVEVGSELTILQTDANLLQLMNPAAGKAAALAWVAKQYGITADQVLAIGDAENDIEMLRWAGTGVAMDNASPNVKAIADWIAPSNNEHGVLAALARYGLCEFVPDAPQ